MGARGAYGMAIKRRGRWFDPALVDALLGFRDDAAFWGPLEDPRAIPPVARLGAAPTACCAPTTTSSTASPRRSRA